MPGPYLIPKNAKPPHKPPTREEVDDAINKTMAEITGRAIDFGDGEGRQFLASLRIAIGQVIDGMDAPGAA